MNKHMKRKHFLYGMCLLTILTALSPVSVFAEAESENSESTFDPYSPYVQGVFEVSPFSSSDYVWDIRTCTVQERTCGQLQLYHPLNVNQQKFYFENFAENTWRISDIRNGKALTYANGSVSFLPMENRSSSTASPSQSWTLEKASESAFYIKASDGNYLTLQGTHNYCGKTCTLKPFTGKNDQKWILNPTWASETDSADTDLVNPYGEDGPYENLYLTIKIADSTEILTADILAEQTTESENHEYVLNPEFLPAYVNSLAEKYNTQDNSRRFITTAGNEIILTTGNYGWKLNTEETLTRIQRNLQNETAKTIYPVWIHKVTHLGNDNGINDMGDSYIEVDLGTQKTWLYQYGELILETDCVTGTYHMNDTVQGAYAVFFKQAPATLTGPGYTSYVDFWMPFYNGYGLHNAGWRNTFGGDIYKSNGSHGCVNLPYEAAETIYNTISVGYPVIVYSSIPEDAAY